MNIYTIHGIPPSKYIFSPLKKVPFFASMKRIETRKQEWMRKHYQAWQTSGLNQTQYCRENHIVLRQFRYWTNKIEAEQRNQEQTPQEEPPASAGFIPIIPLRAGVAPQSIALQYPNGVVLTMEGVLDIEQLRTLIYL